jgi:DNA-binding response OmpR family regulator
MKSILLVEDSKEIFTMVSQAIDAIADLSWAETLSDGRKKLTEGVYDLVLLDMELPDGSGIELCSEIHAKDAQTPIFFLTSHEGLSDKVLGFSAGADDYITKPFAPLELKARIEAKFKKTDLMKKVSDVLKWEELKINKARQEVHILENGKFEKVELTALEFKLLMYFANKPFEVINRDEILDELWGEDVHVYARSVDTHVSKLRKKLGSVSHIIESVHGSGYKFNPKLG